MTVDRSAILDTLFAHSEVYMDDLSAKTDTFTGHQLLLKLAQDQQQAYIDLLTYYRDSKNRSPFNAAHQDIGGRILSVALKAGYERAEDLDTMGQDIFGNPSMEKFYRRIVKA